MEPSATVPAPLMAAAAMLIPRNQDRMFVFVPVVVAVCFRYVNSAGGLYPLHAAENALCCRFCFEIGLQPFKFDQSELSFRAGYLCAYSCPG